MHPLTEFTPWSSLLGGLLIGLASALLLLVNGRVAGISGILGSALGGFSLRRVGNSRFEWWRVAFLAGLPLGAAVWQAFAGPVETPITSSTAFLVAGGLLVGFGTRVGNGCTSGHGVCGLARFSRRSLVATTLFMGTAMITVFVIRHVWTL